MKDDRCAQVEKLLGVTFYAKKMLRLALTHKSYAVEHRQAECNERLEFLGDSILSAAMADHLYHRYPNDDEGKLSRIKSQLVSSASLFIWAKELKLGRYIYLSQGEEQSGGRTRESMLVNVLEALIGALYLDRGYGAAHRFIITRIALRKRIVETDFKSRLQELAQQKYQTVPDYRLREASGPDHNKTFTIEVRLQKKVLGIGSGKNKKQAQQHAARQALRTLR